MAFKAIRLSYPGARGWLDGLLAVLFLGLDRWRVASGTKGNLAAARGPMTAFLALSLPVLFLAFYFMRLQLYVYGCGWR